jgi:hypothetical protein
VPQDKREKAAENTPAVGIRRLADSPNSSLSVRPIILKLGFIAGHAAADGARIAEECQSATRETWLPWIFQNSRPCLAKSIQNQQTWWGVNKRTNAHEISD